MFWTQPNPEYMDAIDRELISFIIFHEFISNFDIIIP